MILHADFILAFIATTIIVSQHKCGATEGMLCVLVCAVDMTRCILADSLDTTPDQHFQALRHTYKEPGNNAPAPSTARFQRSMARFTAGRGTYSTHTMLQTKHASQFISCETLSSFAGDRVCCCNTCPSQC